MSKRQLVFEMSVIFAVAALFIVVGAIMLRDGLQ